MFVGWCKSWYFFPTQNLVCRFPFPRSSLLPVTFRYFPLCPPHFHVPPSSLPPSSPSSPSVCIFSSSSHRSALSQTFLQPADQPASMQELNMRPVYHCDRAAAHVAAVPPPPALRDHPPPLHRHGRKRHMGLKPGGVARVGQAPHPREQRRVCEPVRVAQDHLACHLACPRQTWSTIEEAIPTPKICHHKPWTLIQRCVHRCSETAKRLGASPRPSNAMTLAMTATTVEEAHLLVDIVAKIAIGCSGFGKS